MNWDAVGALAELAGAAAVVVTLAYFAVQIRQSAENSDREAANEIARILGSNSEAARIVRIGSEHRASLTPDELIQFDSLCYLSISGIHYRYNQTGSITDEVEVSFSRSGIREYWEVHSGVFPEDFRREVARASEQLNNAAAQQSAAADSA